MIGSKIKQVVENQKDYSNAKLANFIGISENNLYKLYKRESVETRYLEKICEALKVPMKYFFEDKWDKTTNVINVNDVKGIGISNGNQTTVTFSNLPECLERVRGLEREIAAREREIAAKDKIIELLERK